MNLTQCTSSNEGSSFSVLQSLDIYIGPYRPLAFQFSLLSCALSFALYVLLVRCLDPLVSLALWALPEESAQHGHRHEVHPKERHVSQETSVRERLIGTVGEVRTILSFRISESALGDRLPPGWRPETFATGPQQGGNLRIAITEQLMVLDAEGRSAPTPRFAPLVVNARRAGMAEAVPVVISAYIWRAGDSTYDPYGNGISALSEVKRDSATSPDGVTTVDELWRFHSHDGDSIELALRFVRSVPIYGRRDFKIYSAVNPDFYRIYRLEHAEDVVMSKALNVDRRLAYSFSATGPRLSPLFDGTEELISVATLPWTRREVWLDQ